jgi:hypothetical protein
MSVRRCRFALLVVLALVAAAPTIAQPIVIDDFTGAQVPSGSGSYFVNGTYKGNASPGGTILGTERDLKAVVTLISGTGEVDLTVAPGSGLGFIRALGCSGVEEVWWDGAVNADHNVIDTAVGLGGVNLTANGQNAFSIVVSSAIQGTSGAQPNDMTITVYSGPTAFSSKTFSIRGAPLTVSLPYSGFVQGGASAANFASVRAIDLQTATNSGAGTFAFGNITSISTTPVELMSFEAI